MARFIEHTFDEPNWDVWRKVKNAPLWEVVAISCGIEPLHLRGWTDIPNVPRAFTDRLRLAESILSINGGNLPCKQEGDHAHDVRVELGDFRAWLEHEGFSFHKNFPRHVAKNPPAETA